MAPTNQTADQPRTKNINHLYHANISRQLMFMRERERGKKHPAPSTEVRSDGEI